MIPIQQKILTNHNRPKNKLRSVKAVVIHWTANKGKGANAMANRNYFNSTERSASAHYIVDDSNIIQCIPDNEVAYHVGNKSYQPKGLKLMEGVYSPNWFTIGIEMCVNSDGNFDKTEENTINLVCSLLREHKLQVKNLLRHYDITKKDCPHMYIKEDKWAEFKDKVQRHLDYLERLDNK